MRIELVARDGKRLILPITFGKDTGTLGNRDDLAWALADNKWQVRSEPGAG